MIKQIGPEEYTEISKWWEAQGFPVVPPAALPSTGYMVSNYQGLGIYAGFLYVPKEGNIGWLEWIVANPEAPKNLRSPAFSELVEHITQLAKAIGLNMLFTSADKSKVSFIERLKTTGFIDGQETVTHLIKMLPRS